MPTPRPVTTMIRHGSAWAAVLATGCALAAGTGAASLPQGDGREKFIALCSNCHEMSVVIAVGRSEAQWSDMISTMIDRGAVVPDEDFAVILNYLTMAFPPSTVSGK